MPKKRNIILSYLSSLDTNNLKTVIDLMVKKDAGEELDSGGNCGTMPTNSPTPNGQWICTDSGWQWVPDIGD